MNLSSIKEKLKDTEYDFLRADKHLGNHVILLAIGGSHAYGLNTDTSDIDIRGAALNTKEEILLKRDFEQVLEKSTDTTMYSVNKLLTLLEGSNPNIIELLGLKPEHYLYTTDISRKILENKHIFLSKACAITFGSYSTQQLRKLENKVAKTLSQSEQEKHVLESIENARVALANRYKELGSDEYLSIYTDTSEQADLETEMYFDAHFAHYPLRDWVNLWNDMKSIVRSYTKISKKDACLATPDKIAKHMAHLLRSYMICIDILEKEEVIAYREDEHSLLMSIRNGNYLDENSQPNSIFFEMIHDYSRKLEEAKANTKLPDLPDAEAIARLRIYINERIVKEEL